MVGAREGDGVILMASSRLTQVEMEARFDSSRALFGNDPLGLGYRSPTFTLTVGMAELVIIHADSWPEAFAKLFQTWTPDAPSQPGIPGPTAAIEAGPLTPPPEAVP